MNKLWNQETKSKYNYHDQEIRNKLNPADLMTKYLTKAEAQSIMEQIQNMFETGSPKAAPRLAEGDALIDSIFQTSHSWKVDTSSASHQHTLLMHC